ncbi:ATP cone domain-containing protein, partial [Streptococcus sobrinus]
MITLEKEFIVTDPEITVIKRDGRRLPFDSDKIYQALI